MTELDIDNDKVCTLDLDSNYKPELKIRLLNQWSGASISDFHVITDALSEYFSLIITNNDDYQVVIDGVFGNALITNSDAFKIFITEEAKPARIQRYDLSLGFDYLKDTNYFRHPSCYHYYKDPSNLHRQETCDPNKEFFACFLVKNGKRGDGAYKRTEFFHELSKYKPVTSGGPHLNNIGRIIPKNETLLFLSSCKFTIAFENNLQYEGYMTEKLFQAYLAGSIPLYSGHSKAQEEVNKEAFISRQNFNTNQEMIEYIKQLDQDDKKYCEMWNQPITTDNNFSYVKLATTLKEFIQKQFVDPYLQKLKDKCSMR